MSSAFSSLNKGGGQWLRLAKQNPMASPTLLFSSLAALALLLFWTAEATDFVIYSTPATVLLPGQSFLYDPTPQGIPYGPASLKVSHDCNLVVHVKGALTWASNTTGNGGNCYLTVDDHGEALLLHNFHYPVWRSGKRADSPGSYALMLYWNGAIATYGPEIWSSGNTPKMSSSELNNVTTDYVYYSYSVLPVHTIVPVLEYKNFELYITEECNMVLRDRYTLEVFWQTNTKSEHRDCFVELDNKGEFFLKHNRRDVLWRTGSPGPMGMYILILRYDGTLAIYGSQLWSSKPFW